MSKKKYSLEMVISALDKASGPIGKVSRKMERTFSRIEKISSRAGQNMTRGLTLPVLGMGSMIARTGMQFEQSMNKVQALTGETGERLKELENKAKEMGANTKFSASEAADAMAFLGMAGWSTQKIMTGIPGVLNLAAASNTDLARTADIASNVMGAFRLEADQMNKVADILTATTSGANVDMEMLAETMKMAAPVAKMYGMSLEDTAAAAGILGNIGVQGTMAGTGIRNAILGMVTGGSQAQKVMKALGVQVQKNGKLRDFSLIMGEFGNSLKEIPEAKRLEAINAVFGKIGMTAATELSNKAASGELQNFTEKLRNSGGEAERVAKILNSGMVKGWNEMKAGVEGAMVALNQNGGIREIFIDLTGLLKQFTVMIQGTDKETLKLVVKLTALAAVAGPLLLIFGKVMGVMATLMTFIPAVVKGFSILMLGIKGVGVVLAGVVGLFAAAPILAGALVVALIAAGAAVVAYWDEIWGAVMKGWNWLTSKFSSLGSLAKKLLPNSASFFGEDGTKEIKQTTRNESVIDQSSKNSFSGKMDVRFANAPHGMRVEKVESSENSSIGYKTGFAMGI